MSLQEMIDRAASVKASADRLPRPPVGRTRMVLEKLEYVKTEEGPIVVGEFLTINSTNPEARAGSGLSYVWYVGYGQGWQKDKHIADLRAFCATITGHEDGPEAQKIMATLMNQETQPGRGLVIDCEAYMRNTQKRKAAGKPEFTDYRWHTYDNTKPGTKANRAALDAKQLPDVPPLTGFAPTSSPAYAPAPERKPEADTVPTTAPAGDFGDLLDDSDLPF